MRLGNRTYQMIEYLGDRMKFRFFILIMVSLLGITVSISIAQQNQNVSRTDAEVEALKNRVSELEGKLQTVENVEKMELVTKLADAQAKNADAHAKLIETDFDKLKLELEDSNEQWLRNWIFIILGILSVVGLALWSRLTKKMDDSITNEVEKRINRFQDAVEEVDALKYDIKEAFEQVNLLQDQLRILNKEHAASVLDRFRSFRPEHYPEQIKELEEQAILDVFSDETRHLQYRMKAAEILADRKSTKLVSAVLKCLKPYIDSDFDWDQHYQTQHMLCNLINYIGQVKEKETYETLNGFLEQLLSEQPEVKSLIITSITFSLVYANSDIDKKDSLPVIRKAVPILDLRSDDEDAFNYLGMLF